MAVVVLLGATGPAQARPCEPRILHTFVGQPASVYGGAVARISDVDSDRVADIIVGAPGYTDTAGVVGLVEVRSGRTGKLLHKFHGQPGDRFGYSIAEAGDVDGDSVPDIVVGAPGVAQLACVQSPAKGRVYVHSGRTGALIARHEGVEPGGQFGAAVASAGGGDVVVGAPCANKAVVIDGRSGAVKRTHTGAREGDAFGWGAGALADGYVIGAPDAGEGQGGTASVYDRHGRWRFTVAGQTPGGDFGWFFTASSGDVTGDGRDDVYVSDFSTANGDAYVFDGRDGKLVWRFTGTEPGEGAGPGRGAGDVDRDGRADVVVGSYLSSAGADHGGKFTVYSGRTGKAIVTYPGPNAGELIGFDVVGLGDVNGDGRADMLVSARGRNTVYVIGL
ncbi:hypothetical protein Rhe02_69540 [Rhizocola hellebori]|uniref:VCBS repeat-containing protein n=1 Tax=Rhizocola hellebori TaxID=1392758 RepID=A0A8J3QFW2_9ACTN|nr:hypothetical protein Rhe02_69540 [Rhizocola hellebori]